MFLDNVTLKDHVDLIWYNDHLTSGQGHDLIRKGHIAYQSVRIVGLNTSMVFSSLYLVSIKKKYFRKTADHLS